MKVVPLSTVKPNTPVSIDKIDKTDNDGIDRRLNDLGFVEGREVVIVDKLGKDSFKLRVDNDNPIGLNKSLVDKILVQAEDGDVFVASSKEPKKSGFLASVKNLFSKK